MRYHGKNGLLVFVVVSLFLLSCGGEETSYTECITVADCPDTFLCVDGFCIEGEEEPEVDVDEDVGAQDFAPVDEDEAVDIDEIVDIDEDVEAQDFAPVDDDEGVDIDEIVDMDEDVEAQDFAPVDEDEAVDIDEVVDMDEDVGAQDFTPVDEDESVDIDVDSESGCPTGWVEEYGRCFYFSSDTKTYDDAQNYCESQGGNLVTIEDGVVDAYVANNTDELTWIGLDGRVGAYKVAVSGVPDYSSPQSTGSFGGRYHGNNSDSGLWRSAEIYTIVPGKTGFYDITVTPTAWDPQIRVFTSPTEASLGGSDVAHAWAEDSGITEQLTVELTGGVTYYVATTHCDGCFGGEYDMFISYSGVEDTNYQKHGWPTGELYNYENWYNTNPNEDSDYCVFMYGGDEWDENTCGNLYNYVCEKPVL